MHQGISCWFRVQVQSTKAINWQEKNNSCLKYRPRKPGQ